ncbi:MetJ regulator of methionine regulon [Pseudoalteromonas sp. AOP7-A1-14]|uniref:MetJ regulator of methionine regulon n=1 Tax=unclassified Pseudoalteromonas TaxID=194690 RepID=UPI003F9AB2CA
MQKLQLILFINGCVCFLFGYLRLLSDEKGNVDLHNYRFSGGLGRVLYGFYVGSCELLSAERSRESTSAISIFCGLILFLIGFNI